MLGASGSGKTLALMAATGSSRRLVQTQWSEDESVASVIAGLMGAALTVPAARDALQLIGLGPSASSRPHVALSAGERCLADIAHAVASARGGDAAGDEHVIAIDEFTSVLDRRAAAVAVYCEDRSARAQRSRFRSASVHVRSSVGAPRGPGRACTRDHPWRIRSGRCLLGGTRMPHGCRWAGAVCRPVGSWR